MSRTRTSSNPAALLGDLNPSQREAVTAPDGPILVLAGAGSGKTRAIAHRVAFLIRERNVPPWTVLALTFTNKAAGEMRSRITALVGQEAPDLWVLTFHALGLRLLRRFGPDIGLPSGFVVHDEDDRRTLIRRVIRELGLLERNYPAWRLAAAISARKSAAFSSDRYQRWHNARDRELFEQIAVRYQRLLDTNGGVDFDDLLLRCVELLECSEAARAFANRHFQHVLVDEYQDTNRVQYRLLRLLAPHGNIFVVGDEDQSIYNFRGADLRNILDFERDFPAARSIKLEQNYRSTGAILDAAGALIQHNQERKGKRLISSSEAGSRPRVYSAWDEREEASFVAGEIETFLKQPRDLRIAVLYRTNAQSRALEEELVSRAIPHALVGGQRFYERKEIKDALAYLHLLLNPRNDGSFLRVVNVPARGVGQATLARLHETATAKGLSLWDAAVELTDDGGLPSRAHQGLTSFRELVESLSTLAAGLSVPEIVDRAITSSELSSSFQRETPIQIQTRQENLDQLVAAAVDYEARETEPTVAGFLDNIGLLSDVDQVKDEAPCMLMTLHSAKGLEFDAVFLTGLEEGLFPHSLSLGTQRSVEEERRLCYVGMTRARTLLILTYARSRRAALQQSDRAPSRFLEEIPSSLLDLGPESLAPGPAVEKTAPNRFRKGTAVRHPLFGEGTVVQSDASGRDPKITVAFRRAGRKKLLPKYANLEILDKTSRPG